jgi:hypothetical protein
MDEGSDEIALVASPAIGAAVLIFAHAGLVGVL